MNGVSRAVLIVIGLATFVLVLAALVVLLVLVVPKLGEAAPGGYPPPQNAIYVNGEGKVTAEPDLAQVILGVQTQADEARDAVVDNNQIMERVMAALAELGIAEEDIQTMGFSVQPIIHFDEATGEQEVVGYTVSNSILVKVRDVDQVGGVLDVATTAGANNIGGISFTIEDPSVLQAQARGKAIADARSKAEAIADATGVRLGDLLSVSEYVVLPSSTPFFALEGKGGGGEFPAAEVPISGGEFEIVVQVSITYEIEQ